MPLCLAGDDRGGRAEGWEDPCPRQRHPRGRLMAGPVRLRTRHHPVRRGLRGILQRQRDQPLAIDGTYFESRHSHLAYSATATPDKCRTLTYNAEMAKGPKRLTREQILGEDAIQFIGRRFLDMGFPWHP